MVNIHDLDVSVTRILSCGSSCKVRATPADGTMKRTAINDMKLD